MASLLTLCWKCHEEAKEKDSTSNLISTAWEFAATAENERHLHNHAIGSDEAFDEGFMWSVCEWWNSVGRSVPTAEALNSISGSLFSPRAELSMADLSQQGCFRMEKKEGDRRMRIRSIKPEFWTDKRVSTWDFFTRLLFIGLWSASDDHGRGSAEPARLASELFPYDLSRDPSETLARVAASLDRLSGESRITLFLVREEVFFQVLNWERHQRVDNAGKAKNPAVSEGLAIVSLKSRETRGGLPLEQGAGNREQGAGVAAVPEVQFTLIPEPAKPIEDPNASAKRILKVLNELSGKSFRAIDTNFGFINARLEEEGVTEDGVIAMVKRQCAKWRDDLKMSEFLRPETLFGKTKFEGYYSARDLPLENETRQAIADRLRSMPGWPNHIGHSNATEADKAAYAALLARYKAMPE